ncbi:MAG: hypothetical protein LBJ75_02630 [Puniceicoccales bacterium]|nr:hypothetical protein [Puniceicoccales bacterium]
MKKKKGSILLFVLTCIGILGAMLLTFLSTTTPKRAFYNNAVKSYGFLDKDQNLHGLLELESESVKNFALARVKNEHNLILSHKPRIWSEDKLDALMNALNVTTRGYWEEAGEGTIVGTRNVTLRAGSEKEEHDKTRVMVGNSSITDGFLKWGRCKRIEEGIVKSILAISLDIKQGPAGLKDTIGNILNVLGELERVNQSIDVHQAAEIKGIKNILNGVLTGADKSKKWKDQAENVEKYLENKNRLKEKLKDPQEERLYELVSLKEIEQRLNAKPSIDPSTWEEIKKLLEIEQRLPQEANQGKGGLLNELGVLVSKAPAQKPEEKSGAWDKFTTLISRKPTQAQTPKPEKVKPEDVRLIIQRIFEISINEALKQEDYANSRSRDDSRRQFGEDIAGLIRDQSGLPSNISTSLFSKEKLSESVQTIVNSINEELVKNLKSLANTYDTRTSEAKYQRVRNLAEGGFGEILELNNSDVNNDGRSARTTGRRLQSIYAMAKPEIKSWEPLGYGYSIRNESNHNVEREVSIHMLDNKLPLTEKFEKEVAEAVKLIFQRHGVAEGRIAKFLSDLGTIINVLDQSGSIPGTNGRKQELEYFCKVIEDFRDTKRNLDINIFKEFSSWREISTNGGSFDQGKVLEALDEALAFVKGIESINFYAATEDVRLALLHTLPLRIDIPKREEVGLPTRANNPEDFRGAMRGIFGYGLTMGNNNDGNLQENNEKMLKILKWLHEAEVVNFPESNNGRLNVYSSYSKVMEIVVSVEDKEYKLPLHRTINYRCKIEYNGNAKDDNNTVQTVKEL